MSPEKLNSGSKDIISTLPEDVIYHILSFLSTKETVSTSLLSRNWRHLFAFLPNLDLDDSVHMQQETDEIHTTFVDFVDRVLALQGNLPLNKFSLKFGFSVDSASVARWVFRLLDLGVSDLDLRVSQTSGDQFPSEIFESKSLVRLRIGARTGEDSVSGIVIKVGDVYLPKLKSLYLDSVWLDYHNICLDKLFSGFHVLEDLVLLNIWMHCSDACSMYIPTIKRLTISSTVEGWYKKSPKSVTFDTPALVYFEYTDTVALKYEKMNLDSLIEAKLVLKVGYGEIDNGIVYGSIEEFIEHGTVGDATDLLMGMRNVQILYLSATTIEVLRFCCKAIPMFNNLTHLTIESSINHPWNSLPELLKKCPNLETLIFQGLIYTLTYRCGDVCPCKPPENICTCLPSSPVKVLKIFKFREFDDKNELGQIKHFLESMPLLEEMFIYYDTSIDDNLVQVSNQLQNIPRVASAKCKIQVISDNLNLSFTVLPQRWSELFLIFRT